MTNLALWLSLIVFMATIWISVEVALGWRKIAHLKDMPLAGGAALPKVSIIVSALNEADSIEPALRSLLAIDYPNLEIIAIDDRSTDATPTILDRIATETPSLKVMHIRDLPSGWLGKNHALHCGAQVADGEFLLFTDADAIFDPTVLSRSVAYCQAHRVDHLTLLFDVVARTALLRAMILSFATGLMARFKPWKVNTSPTHFIGVGGFNMVRRSAYLDIGGHAAIALAVLDDIMLGKLIKLHGHRQHILFGTGMVSIEWYRSTPALIRGVEKNAFAALDYRVSAMAALTLLILATRVWPWAALFVTDGLLWWANIGILGAGLALNADLLHARRWRYRCLAFAPVVPLVELWMVWRSCVLTLMRGGIEWRGTRYALKDIKRAHRMKIKHK